MCFCDCVCTCVCVHTCTRVWVSSRGAVGRSSGAQTQSSLGSLKPQPPSPFPSLCCVNNPALFIPRLSPSSCPAANRSYYPRTMGGLWSFHSATERQSGQQGIYLTLWLSRGLIFINELILPNNSSFIRSTHNVCSSEKGTKAPAKAAGDTWDSPGGAIEDPLIPGADEAT